MAGGAGSQHQPREVQVPLALPRGVRAVDVAELALEALVDDAVLLGAGQPAGVLVVVAVDQLEQAGERGAEPDAQPAPVAQVEHARELLPEVGVVEVLGVVGVVGGRHIQLVTARATDTVLAELTPDRTAGRSVHRSLHCPP